MVAGIFLRCPEKFNGEIEHDNGEANRTNIAPLLEENSA